MTASELLHLFASAINHGHDCADGNGLFFFDAGQIYDKGDPLQKDNERVHFSAGVAVAWQSPIGALKFSYALPLASKPGDKTQRFQFQVGTLF